MLQSSSPNIFQFLVVLGGLLIAPFIATAHGDTPPHPRPLMREFIGLNVHTVQFKPQLYAPVCRVVRDYHPMEWDTGADTSTPTVFPMAANRVDWGTMYGSWKKAGFEIDVCVIFDTVAAGKWKDFSHDARAYGEAFARYFGPSGAHPFASSIEVGNEPSKYSEAQYRTIFEAMAGGVRAGDPKLKIATCAVMTGKPDQWSKPLSSIAGLEDRYDVLNVHSYAFKKKWPTWRRSFPEDPSIRYLKDIDDLIAWRNAHARGKEIWLTEFGYDSATRPPPKGPWEKWVGVSDEQQAQYIVRSFLVLSAMDIDRAYLYFFDDKDEPQLHAASGITRNFQPKPSFFAMSHLYQTLGDYRFVRAVTKSDGDLYVYEYAPAAGGPERIFVAWSPTDAQHSSRKSLKLPARINRARRMPLTAEPPPDVEFNQTDGAIEVEVGASPVYLWGR